MKELKKGGGNAKITAEMLVERISLEGETISLEEARKILDFLKILAQLSVNHYLCGCDG